jgi:hypothetical protein
VKKVIKPAEREEAVYYSDFSGALLGEEPPITLTVSMDYGSIYDGNTLELHLNDDDFANLVKALVPKLTDESKEINQKKLNFK